MRSIDLELKKGQDEFNEARNAYNAYSKGKDSASFLVKDMGEIIYNSQHINPAIYFVEKHQSETLSTMIAILHK